MKLTGQPIVVTGVAVSPPIPVDSRSNPINIFGAVVDGGVSTYAVQYTTSDVFAAGYSAASDPQWTAVTGAPTTGTKPYNITGLGATAIRLSVTVGPATVSITAFQSDNTLGA